MNRQGWILSANCKSDKPNVVCLTYLLVWFQCRKLRNRVFIQERFLLVWTSAHTLQRMPINTENFLAFYFFALTNGRRQRIGAYIGVYFPKMIDHDFKFCWRQTKAVRRIGILRVESPLQNASKICLRPGLVASCTVRYGSPLNYYRSVTLMVICSRSSPSSSSPFVILTYYRAVQKYGWTMVASADSVRGRMT